MPSHGDYQEAASKESDRSPVPLRSRQSDPPRRAERKSVQEFVLASGVQVQGLQSGSEGELKSKTDLPEVGRDSSIPRVYRTSS